MVALSSYVKFQPPYMYRRSQKLVYLKPTGIGLYISISGTTPLRTRYFVSSRHLPVRSVYHNNLTLRAVSLPWIGIMGRLTCPILPSISHGFSCLDPGELRSPILSPPVYLRSTHYVAFPTSAPSTLFRSATGDLALCAPVFSEFYRYWVGSLLLVLVPLDSAFLFSQRAGARVPIHHVSITIF